MKNGVLEMFRDAFVRPLAFVASCAFVVACTSSNGDGFAGGTSEDAGIIADLNVAGVAQKGPFVKGSDVTVQGVDCKTMELTGEKFEGKINNDKGEFVVDSVTLSSECAVLEVSGYYMNELTGKKSAKKLTLRALTNLKDRKNVNINVLTELEYERVMNLVAGLKKSFAEAKKQAEKEVLASFNIKGDFDEAEDLNAFEKGDGNAALLAVSVLTLATAGEAEVSERLEEYSTAIADNGSLDEDTKTGMTNWASAAAASGSLDTIRENIESWGYADSVPAFETYVKEFAEDVIPSSSSKAVIPDSVALSSDDHEKSSSSKGDSGTKAGMTSSSSVTSAGSVSSSSSTTIEDPRTSYLNPNIVYGEMTDPRDGQVYKTVKIDDQTWMAQNLNYADSVKMPSLKGNSRCYNDSSEYCKRYGRLYTWAAAQDVCPTGWHLPSETDFVHLIRSVGGEKDASTKLKSTSGWSDYDGGSGNGADTFGFSALPAGVGNMGNYGGVGRTTDFWGSTECGSENSSEPGNGCAYVMYLDYDDVDVSMPSYAAKDLELSVRCVVNDGRLDWSVPKESYLNPDIDYGELNDSRDGNVYKTVKIGNQTWMAENLNYADSVKTPSLKGNSWCFGDDPSHCDVVGRLYTWTAAIDSVALAKDSDNPRNCGYNEECSFTENVQGICPDGWHLPSRAEFDTLVATVGGKEIAEENLRSRIGWYLRETDSDSYGFSAIPVGRRLYDKESGRVEFLFSGLGVNFWSSNEVYTGAEPSPTIMAYVLRISYEENSNPVVVVGKGVGYSIRCVKD